MELSPEKRVILCKGLELQIGMKEMEIREIEKRTEEDYEMRKQFASLTKVAFSLEREKERDIQKIKKEINELKQLHEEINSLQNHLLVVPSFIRLTLSSS